MADQRCRSPPGSPKKCKNKECKKKLEQAEKEIEELRKKLENCKKTCEELQEKIEELEKNQCCCGSDCPDFPDIGKWVPASGGAVPSGAVQSGTNPKYYVARARMDSSLVPGKLTPDHKTCWVAWNNTEIKMNDYEVLVDTACEWIAHTSSDAIPAKAVRGGYIAHESAKEVLYIGRAMYNNLLVPGYVFANSRELLHSSSYTNARKTSYEILVHV